MKKIYIYILGTVSLVAFSFMLLMISPWLNITTIEVRGLNLLEEPKVIKELKLDKTTNILAINSVVAKRRLKDNYYVQDVKIIKKFPNKIVVDIKERELVGYIPCVNNFLYIDKDGLVVDSKPNFKEQLPIIYGLEFETFSIGKNLKPQNEEAFLVMLDIVNNIEQKENIKGITKIDISDLDDIHLYTEKLDIFLGDKEEINIKMNTLDAILKKFTPQEKGFLYIDDINKVPIFKYLT